MAKPKFISRSKNIYNESPPPVSLKKYADKVFEFTCKPNKNQSVTFHLIPSCVSSVIFITFQKSKISRLVVSGPNIKSNPIKTNESVHLLGIGFKPLVLPVILNVKPSLLMNKITELGKLTGKEEAAALLRVISKSRNNGNIVKHISNFILRKIPLTINIEADIIKVADSIVRFEGNIKLNEIYGKISMSRRNFQRKFLEYSGLTPKEFCKIVRFEAVLKKLAVHNYKHLDILWESGFYDQSHYNREFKEFSGLPPSAYKVRQKTISIRNVLK